MSIDSGPDKGVDIFKKQALFFPVGGRCVANMCMNARHNDVRSRHWTLAIITNPGTYLSSNDVGDCPGSCILHMDSLRTSGTRADHVAGILRKYIHLKWEALKEKEARKKKDKEEQKEEQKEKKQWADLPLVDLGSKTLPQQTDSTSCGVYVFKYAEAFCRGIGTATNEDVTNQFAKYFKKDCFTSEHVQQRRNDLIGKIEKLRKNTFGEPTTKKHKR